MRSQGEVEDSFSHVTSLACFSGGLEFLFHENNWEFEVEILCGNKVWGCHITELLENALNLITVQYTLKALICPIPTCGRA